MRKRIVAVLAGVLVAGCSVGEAGDRAGDAPEPRCPAEKTMPAGAQAVPADFAVVWVLRCRDDMRTFPGDGRWAVRLEERADTDAADLLAALSRPDENTTGEHYCPGMKVTLPYFVLVGADGAVVVPRAPVDLCGNPQRAVDRALDALPFRELRAVRLNQDVSEESIASGCGQMWTDAPAGDMLLHTRPAANRRLWERAPESLRVCLWQPRATGYPKLLSSGTVAGTELTALLARLDTLPAARPCGTKHRTFAVLQYVRSGWHDDAAYVELDGCRMILRPDETRGELDPATVALLVRLGGG